MVAVRIDSGKPEALDRPREWPKDQWFDLFLEKQLFLTVNINRDCRYLLQFVEDAEIMWEHLKFKSKEDMIRNGYELDPEEIELAVKWLRIRNPDKAIGYQSVLDKATAEARAKPLKEKAGNPTGNNQYNRNPDNIRIASNEKYGTNQSYLLRRLARDFPEALDRIEAGEFKSARAAGIEYGIVKVKSPYEQAVFAFNKLPLEEKKTFIREMSEGL